MTPGHPTRNWFVRYRLYHIPFWLVYNYLMWVVAIGNPIRAAHDLLYFPFTVKYLIYVFIQAFAVYFNLYFLMPRYLEKSRFILYTALVLLTSAIAAVLITPAYYIAAWLAHTTIAKMWGEKACIFFFFSGALITTLGSTTLGMSIKLTKNWIQSKRHQQALEKEKLETELNFLRYQFNPHFLFNTINSIFFLIHKNPDVAAASLAKFSELLRYQLYECNDERIPLSQEIDYLENFIGLEKLRQNSNQQVTLDINRQDGGGSVIAPFMLMTFVENAFKHVSRHADEPNWITISLVTTGRLLHFSIANSVAPFPASGELIRYGGIGLKNVQRRLDLLYPEQYELDIKNTGSTFKVRLRLELAGISLPKSKPMQRTA
ncbi:MAG TPA: histidine kinase [Puia sp.]|jgi:sensor histidine kinase YesM|nr:histidine kinase [Puia sp.]